MADAVASRMRRAGLVGRTVTLKVRYGDFMTLNRSRTSPAALSEGPPMASLAALLLLVAWNMSELHHFVGVVRIAPKSDVFVLVTCFALTVFFDMVIAVSVGFVLTWFFAEHFSLHTDAWWRPSLFMDKFLNSVLMDDTRVDEQPVRLHTLAERLTERAVGFVRGSKDLGRPFALYLAFPNVHVPLVAGARARAIPPATKTAG